MGCCASADAVPHKERAREPRSQQILVAVDVKDLPSVAVPRATKTPPLPDASATSPLAASESNLAPMNEAVAIVSGRERENEHESAGATPLEPIEHVIQSCTPIAAPETAAPSLHSTEFAASDPTPGDPLPVAQNLFEPVPAAAEGSTVDTLQEAQPRDELARTVDVSAEPRAGVTADDAAEKSDHKPAAKAQLQIEVEPAAGLDSETAAVAHNDESAERASVGGDNGESDNNADAAAAFLDGIAAAEADDDAMDGDSGPDDDSTVTQESSGGSVAADRHDDNAPVASENEANAAAAAVDTALLEMFDERGWVEFLAKSLDARAFDTVAAMLARSEAVDFLGDAVTRCVAACVAAWRSSLVAQSGEDAAALAAPVAPVAFRDVHAPLLAALLAFGAFRSVEFCGETNDSQRGTATWIATPSATTNCRADGDTCGGLAEERLEHLDARGLPLGDAQLCAIAALAGAALTHVDLRCRPPVAVAAAPDAILTVLTDAGLAAVAAQCPSLAFFAIGCGSAAQTVGALARVSDAGVIEVARRCPNLRHLDVSRTYGRVSDTALIDVARRCPQLTHLDVSHTAGAITNAGIINIADRCKKLRFLSVAHTSGAIDDRSVYELADAGFSEFASLDVRGNESAVTDASVLRLRQVYPQLRVVVDDVVEITGAIAAQPTQQVNANRTSFADGGSLSLSKHQAAPTVVENSRANIAATVGGGGSFELGTSVSAVSHVSGVAAIATNASVSSAPLRPKPTYLDACSRAQWVPDDAVRACDCCNATFTLTKRRSHCRVCGKVFCKECCSREVPVRDASTGIIKKEKCCLSCAITVVS